MKWKKFWKYTSIGFHEAMELGLTEEENWTPLLVYIHASRGILFGILGTLLGLAIGYVIF